MLKKLTCVLSLFILSSCVSTENIPIDLAQVNATKPQTITTTIRDKPSFSAMTVGKAGFIGGLLGATAMIVAGNEIVQENNIDDPAGYISNELSIALSSKLGLKRINNNGKSTDSSSPSDLSKDYSHSDLLLDIETTNWAFTYFPTSWGYYRVVYHAKLILLDTRSKVVIAEVFCSRVPDKNDQSPTYDEMLANKASWIKEELKIAADYCISEFKTNVLKI